MRRTRFWPVLFAGLLAYNIARACDVPIWSSNKAGDATDIGWGAAWLVYFLLGYVASLRAVE